MISIQSKWRYLFMFLGIQLVVMALLSREGYQKRVSYFIRIFRKPDATSSSGRNHTAAVIGGGDVYANLSHLSKTHSQGDEMPYCPKTSPLIGEWSCLLLLSFRLLLKEEQSLNTTLIYGRTWQSPPRILCRLPANIFPG